MNDPLESKQEQQTREGKALQEEKDEIRDDIRNPAIPLNLRPAIEFVQAFGDPFTYKIHRNIHMLFGLVWGFPVLVLAIVLSISTAKEVPSRGALEGIWAVINTNPIHYVFLLYPLVSAIVFGAMGSVRKDKTERVENYVNSLEEMTLTDHLTGLYNHRYIWIRIQEEIEKANREEAKLSVLMCDLDGFKAINDNFGHDVGDRCLKAVGGLLRDVCREYDIVARYGGDEFVFILPDTNREDALKIADRITRFMDQTGPILEVEGNPLELGLSIGVSTFPLDGSEPEDILRIADERMYEEKVSRTEG